MPLIRKCAHSRDGWNHGDIDVAFQLFSCGMVWDGNLSSKDGRSHLVRNGYAVQHGGMTAMTGKGTIAFLTHPRIWNGALRRAMAWRRNPLVADATRVKSAMR